jgi:hypothetical protein
MRIAAPYLLSADLFPANSSATFSASPIYTLILHKKNMLLFARAGGVNRVRG